MLLRMRWPFTRRLVEELNYFIKLLDTGEFKWKIMTDKSTFRRSGDPGPKNVRKSSLKAQRESDEDFVMEGSGDSSCSEDDKDDTDKESYGVSSDSSSQEDVKRKVSKKQKDPRNKKEKSPEEEEDEDEDEDEASSDEEVCSVCEVLNIIMNYE